jgi:hypothetical protein
MKQPVTNCRPLLFRPVHFVYTIVARAFGWRLRKVQANPSGQTGVFSFTELAPATISDSPHAPDQPPRSVRAHAAVPSPQPQSGSPEPTKTWTGDLFPILGVTLGKTTPWEISQIGRLSQPLDFKAESGNPCYLAKGLEFWCGDCGTIDHIYLTLSNRLSFKWRRIRFDWDHPYDNWIATLRCLSYSMAIQNAPVRARSCGKALSTQTCRSERPDRQLHIRPSVLTTARW